MSVTQWNSKLNAGASPMVISWGKQHDDCTQGVKDKEMIAGELAVAEQHISNSKFGQILLHRCASCRKEFVRFTCVAFACHTSVLLSPEGSLLC